MPKTNTKINKYQKGQFIKYDIAYIHNYTDSENNNDDSNKKINMNFNCIDD